MQLLLGQLAEHGYIECHRQINDTETMTDLFLAHPISLELLRAFLHVLIMDYTYKTNRYRMPILEIVGLTSTDMTFDVAFVYLQYEKEDNFTWALSVLRDVIGDSVHPQGIVTDRDVALMNAISTVFPNATHLLCRWHISRNVLAKCKKFFLRKEICDRFIMGWNVLLFSAIKEEYFQNLASLNHKFSTYLDVLEYIRSNWLDVYRDRFVAAWTDRWMYFKTTTMNRIESVHTKQKRQL